MTATPSDLGPSGAGQNLDIGNRPCRAARVMPAVPGLRTDFPPLRALDAGPGNLRPASTSFIGRESELDEVQAAVKAHRLVTLTGVGGVLSLIHI